MNSAVLRANWLKQQCLWLFLEKFPDSILARTLPTFTEIFAVLLSPFSQMPGSFFNLDHDCFLEHPLQLIIHHLELLEAVRVTDSLINKAKTNESR
jgi:hypothetical protein